MDKNTKLYLGIGVTALVIYWVWKNRQQFGGAVDVQTPVGGVRASVGGGQVSVGVNPAQSMSMNDLSAISDMNSGTILPDGTLVQQAI